MQWYQLDHMQTIYTSLQRDNHINASSLNFYRLDALPDVHRPTLQWLHCTVQNTARHHITHEYNQLVSYTKQQLYTNCRSSNSVKALKALLFSILLQY